MLARENNISSISLKTRESSEENVVVFAAALAVVEYINNDAVASEASSTRKMRLLHSKAHSDELRSDGGLHGARWRWSGCLCKCYFCCDAAVRMAFDDAMDLICLFHRG